MDTIKAAMQWADGDVEGRAYELRVTLVNGRVLSGPVNSYGAILVAEPDGCDYAYFVNPAHVVSVRVEWL